MAGRTFAIGDIHGDLQALDTVLARLPALDRDDSLVFLGDYLDRGPCSAQVVARIRNLQARLPARIITLRGNHEDGWLRVVEGNWPQFVLPPGNGCLPCMRSFLGQPTGEDAPEATAEEFSLLLRGAFFPDDVLAWMRALSWWYEDEHALYVHAGLPTEDGAWPHPSAVTKRDALVWSRDQDFLANYRGKRVVVGHTPTNLLPPELSWITPKDHDDVWATEDVINIDTGCGKGGFLTALELPALHIYESRG